MLRRLPTKIKQDLNIRGFSFLRTWRRTMRRTGTTTGRVKKDFLSASSGSLLASRLIEIKAQRFRGIFKKFIFDFDDSGIFGGQVITQKQINHNFPIREPALPILNGTLNNTGREVGQRQGQCRAL